MLLIADIRRNRAEKDRSQFAGENNDLRAAMDHVSSDKVNFGPTPKKEKEKGCCTNAFNSSRSLIKICMRHELMTYTHTHTNKSTQCIIIMVITFINGFNLS